MKNFRNYDVYVKTPDSFYRDNLETHLKDLIKRGDLDDDVIKLARTYIDRDEAIDVMESIEPTIFTELFDLNISYKRVFRHFARYNVKFREHFLTQFIQAYKESF